MVPKLPGYVTEDITKLFARLNMHVIYQFYAENNSRNFSINIEFMTSFIKKKFIPSFKIMMIL